MAKLWGLCTEEWNCIIQRADWILHKSVMYQVVPLSNLPVPELDMETVLLKSEEIEKIPLLIICFPLDVIKKKAVQISFL